MTEIMFITGIWLFLFMAPAYAQKSFEIDTFETTGGKLAISFIGHSTLMLTFGGKVIHVDPWSELADYTKMPKADIILVTHAHTDHLDPAAINALRKPGMALVYTEICSQKYKGGIVVKNGDVRVIKGLKIEAVPAYNITGKGLMKIPAHKKGESNGYIITFGDLRVYVSGETDNIPEMNALKGIDIAFLSVDPLYDMTPETAADAARVFMPKIIYPYHYGDTDVSKLVELLSDVPDIEIRIRNLR